MHKTTLTFYIFLCATTLSLLTACEKMADDDTLDGQWRLTEISTPTSTTDMSETGVYWSFHSGLLQITSLTAFNDSISSTFSHIRHEGDSLYVTETYAHTRSTDVLLPDTTTALRPIGLPAPRIAFHIDSSKHRRLTLSAENIILRLQKY